jgi:hypothetical protein
MIEGRALWEVVTSTNQDVGGCPKTIRKLSSVHCSGNQNTLPPMDSHSPSGLNAIVMTQ